MRGFCGSKRLTVTSSTFPAGTKVMIVFGSVVDRTTWTYSGLYDGATSTCACRSASPR